MGFTKVTLTERLLSYLESKGRTFNMFCGLACVAIIGIADILSPQAVSFNFMYLFPIFFQSWLSGRKAGFFIALVGSAFWSIDNVNDISLTSIWNIFSTIAIFCTVAVLIAKIRELLKSEKTLSRTDSLTGVMNSRAFSEVVEYEIIRHRRDDTPFSIAYLDLDNFKSVNDLYGHKIGDTLLIAVIKNLANSLRNSDIIARVGGDEFVIFLPETGQEDVSIVMEKVKYHLHILSKSENMPVSFSMGVLTCDGGEIGYDEIMSIIDGLMYEVKKDGKGNIRYSSFSI